MIFEPDFLFRLAIAVLITIVSCSGFIAALFTIHLLLTLPLRRAERARFFLDLVETAIRQGEPVEAALVSISQTRDRMLGARFHLLAAWLQKGLRLDDALAKVPRLLPPQIIAMLRSGARIGDLSKVLPACRQYLNDALSQMRGAISYVIILAFVITPTSLFIFAVISVKVFPALNSVAAGLGTGEPTGIQFLLENRLPILLFQSCVIMVLWTFAIIYACGPRAISWFPFLNNIFYRLPWRRKRMQRDFSAMLSVLLDSGMPEAEALTLAAECTANPVFQKHAQHALDRMKQGLKLTEAVALLDNAGEFRWRLTNAAHGNSGFLPALAGWHEALDAKAFQQEQAAAHGITTALVLVNGVFVGAIVTSVFSFLIGVINEGILW